MEKDILKKENRKNDIITVKGLFSKNYFYRVPDYQRGYSWSANKEFLELWRDILRIYRSNNDKRMHYTGMITLEEISESGLISEDLPNTDSFYIVDGQQRITSIVIILKTILDYAQKYGVEAINSNSEYQNLLECGISPRFGYSGRRKDGSDIFFKSKIYKSDKNAQITSQYFKNINDSQLLIEKELDGYCNDDIVKILDVILGRLVFNVYFVTNKSNDFDVRVIFETMNNRGKPLTNLELLKNRLMYLSTFFKNDIYSLNLQNEINNQWNNIYVSLNYGDSHLFDDDYLKAHWIVYKGLNKKKGNFFVDEILNNYFSIDSGKFYDLCQEAKYREAFDLINDYVTSLGQLSKYWQTVNAPESKSINIDEDELNDIKKISRLPNKLYMKATVMVVLQSNNTSKEKRKEFYEKLENFVFINILLGQDKNDLSFLATGAKDLLHEKKEQNKKLDDLINSFNKHALALTEERVKNAIADFANYINKKENYSYYGWNGLNYFLYEFNESLNIHNAAKIEWYKVNSTSIEHILPQTPESDYWKTAFSNYLGTDNGSKIINSLGNLLLLSSSSENSSLCNYSFPVKKEMSVQSKKFSYKDGSRSARKVAECDYWTPKEIFERTNELLKFLYDHWLGGYLNENDWEELVKEYNLVNFQYTPLSDSDYDALKKKLDSIDVSKEREGINKIFNSGCRTNSFINEIKRFFNSYDFYLVQNSKKVSYIAGRYTMVLKNDSNEAPRELKIGTLIDNHNYTINYYYTENTISIIHWENGNYVYDSSDSCPDILKKFLNCFYKYIKQSLKKDKPHENVS